MKHDSLLIVGGGPIGMLTALICRDMFSNITILERQTKEKFFSSRYTFPVVLTPCANDVLKQVEGLLDILRPTQSPYDELKIQFKVLGRRFSIYKTFDVRVNSFWRDSLIQAQYELVSKAKNIDMHFGCEMESIDFDLNICHETKLGALQFDLLVGADGCHSQTRQAIAEAHPLFDSKTDFSKETIHSWHAFNVNIAKVSDHERASSINVEGSVSVIGTLMQYPQDVINYVFSAPPGTTDNDFEAAEKATFPSLAEEDMKELKKKSEISGKYYHVKAPTFCFKSCVLLGDSAHCWLSCGDLLSCGVLTVGKLYAELQKGNVSIPDALKNYDETTGKYVRFYSSVVAYPRAVEGELSKEPFMFRILSKVGLTAKHLDMYKEGFDLHKDMEQFMQDLRTIERLKTVISFILMFAFVWALLNFEVIRMPPVLETFLVANSIS